MHKVLWTVSLSNGETLYEEKGNFITVSGEMSPWNKLLAYLEQTGALITSLSLYTEDGRRFNLPSAGKSPKFKEFADLDKPVRYRMFRKMGADVVGSGLGDQERYTVAEATYEEKKLQVWVDEKTLNCWSLIVKN